MRNEGDTGVHQRVKLVQLELYTQAASFQETLYELCKWNQEIFWRKCKHCHCLPENHTAITQEQQGICYERVCMASWPYFRLGLCITLTMPRQQTNMIHFCRTCIHTIISMFLHIQRCMIFILVSRLNLYKLGYVNETVIPWLCNLKSSFK